MKLGMRTGMKMCKRKHVMKMGMRIGVKMFMKKYRNLVV